LQLTIAPDRQQAIGIGEEELRLVLAAPIVDSPSQVMPGDQFGG